MLYFLLGEDFIESKQAVKNNYIENNKTQDLSQVLVDIFQNLTLLYK